MEKFMYLFDFEFKRNLKCYIGLVSSICIILFINLILNLRNYNFIMKEKIADKGIEELYNISGNFNFSNLITPSTCLIFTLGIVACLSYSLIIWMRDFKGKNKSIYTLLMIPSGRIKIYISKLLNILCLVYMYLMSFIMVLLISYKILPKFMEGKITTIGFVQDTSYILGMWLPYNFVDFIGLYVLLITAIISTIFTIILINKSSHKVTKIMPTLICIIVGLFFIPTILILIFLLILGVSLSKSPFILVSIGSIVTIVGCFLISQNILNRKLDF